MIRFSDEAVKDTTPYEMREIFKIIGGKSRTGSGASDGTFALSGDDCKTIANFQFDMIKSGLESDHGTSPMTLTQVEKRLTASIPDKLRELVKKRVNARKGADDSWSNDLSGVGSFLDPAVHNQSYTPIVTGPNEPTAYYSNGGIARTVIDKKTHGLFLNGYGFTGPDDNPDDLKRLKDSAEETNFEEQAGLSLADGEIYGGSAMMTRLEEEDPAEGTYTMSIKQLGKAGKLDEGCINGFWGADRWNMVLIPNYDFSASDYLTPKSMFITMAGFEMATERMGLIRPNRLPYWGTIRQLGWGTSDFVAFMPSLMTYEIMRGSIQSISQQLSLVYLKMPIDDALFGSGVNSVRLLQEQNQKELSKMSSMKPSILSITGELASIQRSWTEFPELMLLQKQDVGAKSGISHTVLFNEMQAGQDEKNYDVTLKQGETLRRKSNGAIRMLQTPVEMLVYHTFGYNSPQGKNASKYHLTFSGFTVPTQEQRIATLNACADSATKFYQAGFQLGDAVELIKQQIPEFDPSKEMMDRIAAFDDAEMENRETQAENEAGKSDFEGQPKKPQGAKDADFVESEHPRKDNGEFGNGVGSRTSEYMNRSQRISSSKNDTDKRQKISETVRQDKTNYQEAISKYPNIKKATSSMQKSIKSYTGDKYVEINRYARTGSSEGLSEKEAQSIINNCSEYIDKNRIIEETTLFRGIPGDLLLNDGDILPCVGIGSFSSSHLVANRFAYEGRESSIIEMVAKKGSNIAPVNGYAEMEQTEEMEYIMKPGTRMKCIGKTKNGDRWIYQMEIIGES